MLDDESMKIGYGFVGGESANAVRILQQPGVINWNTNIKILKGIPKHCRGQAYNTLT